MLTWLYDEDRWPSGAGGGLVTRDHKYRIRFLLLLRSARMEKRLKTANFVLPDRRSEAMSVHSLEDIRYGWRMVILQSMKRSMRMHR